MISENIISIATQKHLTIASAESITGGRIASHLTSISGSSKVFMGGVVCYSENAKIHSAGVDVRTLNEYGVYSHNVVAQMAERIAKRNQADIGISTSGCAEEGASDCDQGNIYFGFYTKKTGSIQTELQHFSGSREEIQNAATQYVLKKILELLNSHE